MEPELKAAGPSTTTPPPDGDDRWPDSFRKRGYVFETYLGIGITPERVDVYKDGAPGSKPIFEDRGDTLRAIDTSIETVKAMADLAAHRGWDRIEISGGDASFQRASWMELNARGIETTGYKPNERDLQELARRIIHPELGELTPRPLGAPGADAGPGSPPLPSYEGNDGIGHNKLPPGAGELIEHGPAPYKFDAENNASYFARLRMEDGSERTLWGLGIGDAIAAKAVEPGDVIKLDVTAREPVEVQTAVRDGAGNIVGQNTIGAIRNAWEVEVLMKVERELPEQSQTPPITPATANLSAALDEMGVSQVGTPPLPGVAPATANLSAALDEMGVSQVGTPPLPGVAPATANLSAALDEMGVSQVGTPPLPGVAPATANLSAALDEMGVSQVGTPPLPGVAPATTNLSAALDEMGVSQVGTPPLPGVAPATPDLSAALDEMGVSQVGTPPLPGVAPATPDLSAALDEMGVGQPAIQGPSRPELAAALAANDVARAELHPDLAAAFAQVARLDLVLEEGHVEDGERHRVVEALRGELIGDLTAGVPVEPPTLRSLGDRPDAGEISQAVASVFEQSGQITRQMMALESIHHFQDVALADVDRAESPNAVPGVDINRRDIPTPAEPNTVRQTPEIEMER